MSLKKFHSETFRNSVRYGAEKTFKIQMQKHYTIHVHTHMHAYTHTHTHARTHTYVIGH